VKSNSSFSFKAAKWSFFLLAGRAMIYKIDGLSGILALRFLEVLFVFLFCLNTRANVS